MRIDDVNFLPYFLEVYAFKHTPFVMRSCTKPKKVVDKKLEVFDAVASSTRKPIKCRFGTLKFWSPVLKYEFTLTREEDISYVATASMILNNLSMTRGDLVEGEIEWDVDNGLHHHQDNVPHHVHENKRQKDALFAYLTTRDDNLTRNI